MKRIDHNNYEAWLLDRMEGNLTPDQERQLDAFLAQHPHLDPGFTDAPTLQALTDALSAREKETLKRDLPPTGLPGEPIDDFLVARLEGDLTPEQEEALRKYLSAHPEHARAERIMALAKVRPDSMTYQGKADLHRALPPMGKPTMELLDDFLVARLEGDLDAGQEEALAALIASEPVAARAWALMSSTQVQAAHVAFPDKASLKRGARVIPLFAAWGPRLRMAAAIALLLGVGLTLIKRDPAGDPGIASVQEEPATMEQPVKEDDGGHKDGTVTPADAVVPEEGLRGDGPEEAVPAPRKAVPERQAPQRVPSATHRDAGTLAQQPTDPAAHDTTDAPLPMQDPEPFIAHQEVVPLPGDDDASPQELPVAHDVPAQALAAAPEQTEGIPVGVALAGLLRERILDREVNEPRALEPDDAVAAIDKGLRSVGGAGAGLSVDRRNDGSVSGFDLRLGRNLAIRSGR